MGIRYFYTYVLSSNDQMLHVFLHTGFVVDRTLDTPGIVQVSFDVAADRGLPASPGRTRASGAVPVHRDVAHP